MGPSATHPAGRRPPRRRWRSFLAVLLACAAGGLATPSVAVAAGEAELKAAIVYNLLLFVEWPPQAAVPESGALTLCVGSTSPLADALRTLDRRPVGGRVVAVRELAAGSGDGHCDARYVDGPARSAGSDGRGLLVISDDVATPPESAAIVLRRLDSKVGFDLDLRAARRAGLQLSAKLSRLARTVHE